MHPTETDRAADHDAPPADDPFLQAMQAANTNEAALQAACVVSARLALAAATVEEINRQHPEDNVPADRQLFSIGRVCQFLRADPVTIRLAMKAARVPIALAIDETVYIDAAALLAVRDELRRQGHYPANRE